MGRQPYRRRTTSAPNAISFAFLGFEDGWYILRADIVRTTPSTSLIALAFEGRVTEWLITQRITPGTWSHFGSGNTGEYPLVPEVTGDEHALHLLLKRPADVLRVADNFPCTGITTESLMAAVRAEANVHRFIIEDIAKLAHDANRGLMTLFGTVLPTWEDLGGESRVALLMHVRHRLDRPEQPAPDVHAAYVDQRLKDGWRFGATHSERAKTDPFLVPWKNLRPVAHARYRQLLAVIDSLAPLLKD